MSTEVLVLALSAVVRPTSATAVVVMLSSGRPQRLLTCYVLTGLAFSLGVGALVLVLAANVDPATSQTARPVVDLVLGLASLAYAGAAWLGHLPQRARSGPPTWLQQRMRNLSPRGAAALGVLTHLPGLLYLAALNAIADSATGTLDDLAELVVYNAFRFGVPIVALTLSASRPALVRDCLQRATSWARSNRRGIVVAFFGALGGYLVAAGASDIARLP